MAFVFAEDMVRGWAGTLQHCELVVVARPFTREDMLLWDPDYVDTVYYAELGEVLMVDKSHDWQDSGGWQSARRLRSPVYPVWVHPATLARICVRLWYMSIKFAHSLLGHLPAFGQVDDVYYADARTMPGKLPDMAEHVGNCPLVAQAKLRSGQHVMLRLEESLRGLWRASQSASPEIRVICFCCDHGKHRSRLCAHWLELLCPLCPVATTWRTGRRYDTCRHGCAPLSRAELCHLLETRGGHSMMPAD